MSKVDELKKELGVKKIEIKSLLELTMAINSNKPSGELFKIYMFILTVQQRLSKVAIIARPDGDEWGLVGEHGFLEKLRSFDINDLVEKIEKIKKATPSKDIEGFLIPDVDFVLPVYHKDEALAFAFLSKRENDDKSWDQEQIQYIQTITNIITVAVENKKLFKRQLFQARFKREMELAAEIQQMLIPSQLPDIPHLEMFAKYLPHSEVGGDYYDVIKKNNHLFFCIGDISGKGTSAALLMSNVQANVRALVKENISLTDIVRSLNQRFVKITKGDRFITFFIASLDLNSGDLKYVNAGHNHPILLKDDDLYHLDSGCTILGVFDKLPSVIEGKEKLNKNDVLFLYTDGLSDLEDKSGEHFGEERIDDMLIKFKDYPMNKLLLKIELIIEKYRGDAPYYDDISYLAIKQTF